MPPKKVNNPIGQKIVDCVSLSKGNWFLFLKFLEFNSFGNIHKERMLEEGGRGSRQKLTCIVFMMSFYCLKACKGQGVSENHQIWAYILYGWFLSNVLYRGMSLCSPLKFCICDISYTIFYKKFNIFSYFNIFNII